MKAEKNVVSGDGQWLWKGRREERRGGSSHSSRDGRGLSSERHTSPGQHSDMLLYVQKSTEQEDLNIIKMMSKQDISIQPNVTQYLKG